MSQAPRDQGFTMIEVLVTIAIMGIVMAFSVSGWGRYARAHEQSGTAAGAAGEPAQRSAAGRHRGHDVLRQLHPDRLHGVADHVPHRRQGPGTRRRSTAGPGWARAVFTPLTTAQAADTVVFTPRGTASQGDIHVTRPDSAKDYKVAVDGFTGRVSLCDESGCNGA